jgi:hypothetical protein
MMTLGLTAVAGVKKEDIFGPSGTSKERDFMINQQSLMEYQQEIMNKEIQERR